MGYRFMSCRQQLDDSKYLLDLIKSRTSRNEIRPLLNGFLTVAKSIPEYLLEDYNRKLGLNIALTQKLDPNKFAWEAIEKNNQRAIQFIYFYNNELKGLQQGQLWKLISNKRNLNIYRTFSPLRKEFFVRIEDNVSIPERLNTTVRDKEEYIKKQMPGYYYQQSKNYDVNKNTESRWTRKSKMEVKWFFHDYSKRNLLEVCTDFLSQMEFFVNKIERQFP